MPSLSIIKHQSSNTLQDYLHSKQDRAAMAETNAEEEEDTSPLYNDAFPSMLEQQASPEGAQEMTNALTSKRSLKSITKIFHVSLEKEGGDPIKLCVAIMKKTGAKLELYRTKRQGLFISVSGTADVVLKAQKEIMSKMLLQDTDTLEIPKENHRFVIGKNGMVLQELELKTATTIQIPRREDPSNQIKISGTKEAQEMAKHQILLISAEQDKHAVERVNIDKVYHPFITGAHNMLVEQIMQETGTCIHVPPQNVNNTEIVVTGERQQVVLAMGKINKIFEDTKKNTTSIAVEVKKSQHKYVIGLKGKTLQDILLKTGVSVEVPPSDSSSETVILRGEPGRLVQALTEVFIKANSYTTASVSAPSWLHGHTIGKKGQNLAKITQQMPKVQIEFKEGEDEVTLKGPTQDVRMVQSQIKAIVTDLVSCMDYAEIRVDPKVHGQLIGKRGVHINRIKEKHKVNVHIPPHETNSSLIRIEGDIQGVQEAKKELLELASQMANITQIVVSIPSKLHNFVIGSKGCFLRSIAGECGGVQFRFPPEGSGIDKVIIRGFEEDVQKAKQKLLALAEEQELRHFTQTITVDSKYHPKIIGRKGETITAICTKHDVKINFPERDDENPDQITITGYEHNAVAARDAIQAMVKVLQDTISKDIYLDSQVHARIIGARGNRIQEIRDRFKVDIRFPGHGAEDPELVTVKGRSKRVIEAIHHLHNLENKYMEDDELEMYLWRPRRVAQV